MVWSNDPGHVNRGKGYRVVNWLDCPTAFWGVDVVYPIPDGDFSQQPLLLALRPLLIVSQATQYVVYGWPRFRRELCTGRYSFDRRGDLNSADRLLDISLEVDDPDKLFHHKFQASALVGLVPVVFMVITPQRLIALYGI